MKIIYVQNNIKYIKLSIGHHSDVTSVQLILNVIEHCLVFKEKNRDLIFSVKEFLLVYVLKIIFILLISNI